jgi:hypothetical protein
LAKFSKKLGKLVEFTVKKQKFLQISQSFGQKKQKDVSIFFVADPYWYQSFRKDPPIADQAGMKG